MTNNSRLSESEFSLILMDETKRIEGDIHWTDDEDHSPAVEFRAEIQSDEGWPMFVKGSYNRSAKTLTFALILRTEGRIYGLDMGKDHRNPNKVLTGKKHKHTWTEENRDKLAYVPNDISATIAEPVEIWKQFCKEARIVHDGELRQIPDRQEELFP